MKLSYKSCKGVQKISDITVNLTKLMRRAGAKKPRKDVYQCSDT